jgi:hypothetical protein
MLFSPITEREPSEAEWAVVGRYLAGRLDFAERLGPQSRLYEFDTTGTPLIGPNAVSAVMRAIVAEDDVRREMEGRDDRRS